MKFFKNLGGKFAKGENQITFVITIDSRTLMQNVFAALLVFLLGLLVVLVELLMELLLAHPMAVHFNQAKSFGMKS